MNEEDTQTKFSAGMASAIRLHKVIEECNYYSSLCFVLTTQTGETTQPNVIAFNFFREKVEVFYREVSAKLKKKDKELLIKKVKEYKKNRKNHNFVILTNTPKGQIKTINCKIFKEVVKHYKNIEISIRELADKKGLLNPNKRGASGSLAEMD